MITHCRSLSCFSSAFLALLLAFGPWLVSLAQAQSPRPRPPARRGPPKDFVPPQLKTFVQAPYPPKARKEKRQAVVKLLLIVDARGKVAKATVLEKAGHGFDEAALAAAKQFVFVPGTYKGKPVPVKITYGYHFVLRKKTKSTKATPRRPDSSRPTPRRPDSSRPTPRRPDSSRPTPRRPAPSRRPTGRKETAPQPPRRAPTPRRPTPGSPAPRPPTPRPNLREVKEPTALPPSEGLGWEGYVRERGTRDPIEVAQVYLLGRKYRAREVTDQNGRYRFKRVPSGRFRVVIQVPNYKKFEQVVRFPKGKKRARPTWYLTRVGGGQFVSVTRERRKKKEIHRKTLQRDEVELVPGTQGDPLKVVQNLPGVARTPLNTGFFVVRGSAPEDSRVYIDGHQIPQLYHFGGLTAVVNADIAKGIDLIPGGFSVAFGRSTGGVIQVSTRKGADQWHGYLDMDLIDLGFFLEGPLWKGANLIISARRSHIDFFLGLVLPEIPAFDLTVAPRYYDYQIKLDWQVNKHHNLSLMYFGSRDLLTFLRDAPIGGGAIRGEFGFYSMFHRLQFRWRFSPGKTVTHDFSLHAGFGLNDIKGGTTLGFANTTWIIALRDELRWQIIKPLSLRGGIDVRLRHIAIDLRLPSNIPREGNAPGSQGANLLGQLTETKGSAWVAEPALYLELDWRILPSLRAQAGVRFDYATSSHGTTFDPRLTLTWNTPWKPLSFVTGVGLFSQPPQLQESSVDFGNPALQAEHAVHVTLGSNVQWTSYFNTEVTFFYKHMYDLIVNSDRTVQRGGQEVSERLRNGGLGRAYGLELLIRHKPHRRFFGWISYTLSRSERQDNPGDPYRLFSFDQSHILTLVAAYKIGWGLSVSARFRLVSGNPTTPLRGGIYDADQGSYFPIPGPINSERNPLFHQLDLRIDYRLTFNTWKLMFYADVQNVYNQPNQEGVTYNYDYTKRAPLTGIPIFPSFGIKGQF